MTVLVVDANNMAMRSIFAMRRTNLSSDGVPTGALLVFINSLSRHVREESPSRVVVCWDQGPSEFRRALYPEYKASRKTVQDDDVYDAKFSQFGLMGRFLTLANFFQSKVAGWEADDLIAHYVHWAIEREEKVVIVSSDKDFLQLLEPISVEQVRLSSGGAATDRWTAQRVEADIGCKPWQVPLAMALAGDESDGVPGVPRFGMKTAIKALTKAEWDLEAVDHPNVAERRVQVRTALKLVDLRTPHPDLRLGGVPRFEPTFVDSALYEPLIDFMSDLQLESVKHRLLDRSLWKDLARGAVDG